MKNVAGPFSPVAASAGSSRHNAPRRGFTLVELMVLMGIMALLVGLLMAAVQGVRLTSAAATCTNNLRQIGLAMQQFKTSEDQLFAARDLRSKLAPFMKDQTNASIVFSCPLADSTISYGANFCLERFQPEDGKIVVVDATQPDVQWMGGNAANSQFKYAISPRHRGMINALHYGGNVQRYVYKDLDPYDASTGPANIEAYWQPKNKTCSSCFVGGSFVGTYYGTANFTGPSVSRNETTLHLPFGANPGMYANKPYNTPNPPIPSAEGNMSTIYTGRIRADKADDYTFWLCVDNDAWVYFNGKLIRYRQAGGWGFCSTCVQYVEQIYTVHLDAYEWFDFEIRQANYGGPSHISVMWSNSSNPQPSEIPSSNLSIPQNYIGQ